MIDLLINKIKSPRILLIGDFILDKYIYGDVSRISPEAPTPILKITDEEDILGGASSVASNIREMGGFCSCLGVIGDDENADKLLSRMRGRGIDTDNIVRDFKITTTVKERIIGVAQHCHKQQLIRLDREKTEVFDEEIYEELISSYKRMINYYEMVAYCDMEDPYDIICLQDYDKGIFKNVDFCREIINIANEKGKKVILDPHRNSSYDKFRGIYAITPNRIEASEVSGIEIKTIGDASKAAEVIREKFSIKNIIITLDKDGVFLSTETEDTYIKAKERKVYDVTGAGDVMIASYAVAVASGIDDIKAIEIANIASGLSVEKFGTAVISKEEIIREICKDDKQKNSLELIDLLRRLNIHRNNNEKIVFTNGCFDILHRGHIECLRFAKEQGDILVVGLNSDASVKAIKGAERPINNQEDRAMVLSAMHDVDYVHIFDEETPADILSIIQPDIMVKGSDWKDKDIIEKDIVKKYGGKVIFFPIIKGKSTTNIIEKIKD